MSTESPDQSRPARPAYSASRLRFSDFKEQTTNQGKNEAGNEGRQSTNNVSSAAKWRHYYHWLRPFRRSLLFVFFLAVVGNLFELIIPYGTRFIIDDVLIGGEDKTNRILLLHYAVGAMLLLLLSANILNAWRSQRTSVINSRAMLRLRELMYGKILYLPLGDISELKAGGIVSRLSSDVRSVTGLLQSAIISPGTALLRVILTLVVLFTIQPQLALVAGLFLPPLFYLSYVWIRRIRPIYRSMAKDRSEIDSQVAETFGGIRVVRAFGRQTAESRRYRLGHHTIIRKRLWANLREVVIDAGWSVLIPAMGLVIVWVGGLLYFQEQASIGDIVAFQMYTGLLLNPVWRIVYSISNIQQALASMDRIIDILEREKEMPANQATRPIPQAVHSIEVDQVSFRYPATQSDVLRGVSLQLKQGETIALVGQSGAGKTTLVDLMARFYDVTTGTIRLNGIDIREFHAPDYRRLFAVVSQDVFLFDGTLYENIVYGRSGPFTPQELDEAVAASGVAEFLPGLPKGLNTVIGERGFKLSGGQKQRLSIARAFLSAAPVWVLDEATSNLDSQTENFIQSALFDQRADRTKIIIAHRLSTVSRANRIYVLQKGALVEQGSHAQLMGAGGVYARLAALQDLT